MRNKKIHLINILLIVGSVAMHGAQIWGFRGGVQGFYITFFILISLFNILMLVLTLDAIHYKTDIFICYSLFQVILGIAFTFSYIIILATANYSWASLDSILSIYGLVGSLLALFVIRIKKIEFTHPLVKSLLAILFKPIPQLVWALSIFKSGAANLSGTSAIIGDVLLGIQVCYTMQTLRMSPLDPNRRWQAIATWANFLTWFLVSIAWLTRKIF